MITKYTEYIKENNQFLINKEEIKNWLDRMRINNYTINDDLTVDVDWDVDISDKNLTKIPVKFNKVNGNFYCNDNKLTTLEGCPKIVKGYFNCSNNKLITLEYCPKIINNSIYCYTNKLISLEGCPTTINGDFNCFNNKLTSLKYCPKIINGSFNCSNNKLITLEYCPTSINNHIIFYNNLLLEDINDLVSKILIKNINGIEVSQKVFDKYFEYWIDKDSNILEVLKDKVSDNIKQKYSHLFQANNFDLI